MSEQNEASAIAAAQWWTERLESGDKDVFRETLRQLVLGDLEAHGRCYLECDYDPRGHLLTAVQAAGHQDCKGFLFSARGILPQKHELEVTPTVMRPKEGYGNWTEEITVRTRNHEGIER